MSALDGLPWQFATAVYERPGVAAACIAVQDSGGIDVVLLLTAGYAARCGVPLDSASLDLLDARISAWRTQIVQPLRSVRRTLKHLDLQGFSTEALRRDVQSAEIAAEQLELAALADALPPPAAGCAAIPVLTQLQAVLRRGAVGGLLLADQIRLIAAAMDDVPVGPSSATNDPTI